MARLLLVYIQMNCFLSLTVPVARAADVKKRGTGVVRLSDDDPCLVIGVGTRFTQELKPKWQIMLSKNLNYMVAEVIEVISDTEVRIKREFGSDSGKGTARVREMVAEVQATG